MGSRLKDLVYISIIVFLGVGVWTTYKKDNSSTTSNEWNWSERGQVNDMEENLLQIDGRFDDEGYNELVGEADGVQMPFDIHETFEAHEGFRGPEDEFQLLQRQEDIVHGENQLLESIEDQVDPVDDYGNQQNILLQQQEEMNSNLLAAAGQIIQNHASQNTAADGEFPDATNSNADNQLPVQQSQATKSTAEKLKPKLVFRSNKARDVETDDSSAPKIPRIIHQSWESTDIPMNFAKWVASWLEKNPGWEYWFWTPSDVQALLEESYPSYTTTLDSSVSLENRANIMRYFIIHAHGGVYAELDMECLNNIDTWIFSHGCFLAEEAREHSYLVHNILTGTVINAIMACRPHHPFYEVILHALPDYLIKYQSDPRRASGSLFLDEIFRAFKKHPLPPSLVHYGDVALIEPDYFIPSYDQKHWTAIDNACNSNIADMPFHVSWLCTLWIRKRMHENQPYEHSYTDHHWIDPSILGRGNIVTIPITTIIQSVIAGGSLPDVQQIESQSSDKQTGVDLHGAQLGANDLGLHTGVSGPQTGVSGLNTGVQIGLSGVQTGLSGVQPGLSGVQPSLSGVQPGLSGVQPGLSGVQPGLSGVQPGLSGVQPGLSGVQTAVSGTQVGVGSAPTGVDAARISLSDILSGVAGIPAIPSGAQAGLSGAQTGVKSVLSGTLQSAPQQYQNVQSGTVYQPQQHQQTQQPQQQYPGNTFQNAQPQQSFGSNIRQYPLPSVQVQGHFP